MARDISKRIGFKSFYFLYRIDSRVYASIIVHSVYLLQSELIQESNISKFKSEVQSSQVMHLLLPDIVYFHLHY